MPEIEIRKAQPEDYEKIAEMHYPVWLESYNVIMPPSMTDVFVNGFAHVWYPQRVSEGDTIMLAESDGKPVGMIIFGPDPNNPNNLHIGAMYIKREKQRGGIGSALLEKALASQPSGDVTLSCTENNRIARDFYEQKGFERDGNDFRFEPWLLGVEASELGYIFHR